VCLGAIACGIAAVHNKCMHPGLGNGNGSIDCGAECGGAGGNTLTVAKDGIR